MKSLQELTSEPVQRFVELAGYKTLSELQEAMDRKVMEFLKKVYPDKDISFDMLVGSSGTGYNRIDFCKAADQEKLCEGCGKRGRIYNCLSGGYLWDVMEVRGFIVAYPRECGNRQQELQRKEREKKRNRNGSFESPIEVKGWWDK